MNGKTIGTRALPMLIAAALAVPVYAQEKADRPDLEGVPDKPHLEEDEPAGEVVRPPHAAVGQGIPDLPQPVIMNPGWEHGGVPWKFLVSNAPQENRPGIGSFGAFEGYLEESAARTGRRGYAIRGSDEAGDAVASLENEARDLMPGRMYRATFHVRGEDVDEAYLTAGSAESAAAARLPSGTFDWTPVTVDFTPAEGEDRVPVKVVVVGPAGELNVDDVRIGLSPLQDPTMGGPAPAPDVQVDEATVKMDRAEFDVLEKATGRFLQPAGQGTGGVLRMRMQGPASMIVGRTRVPLDAPDGPRQVPFEIPVAGLPDGEYTIIATLDNKPAGEATFTKVNKDDAIDSRVEAIRAELAEVKEAADAAGVAEDPYINMGIALIERFTERVETGGEDANQNRHWDRLQLQEMTEVLAEVRADIDQRTNGPALPGAVKMPSGGRFEVDGGDVMMPIEGSDEMATYFPMGFGHFVKVRRDIPNHHTWGGTIIQQGAGMGMLQADGTLKEPKGEVPQILAEAEAADMKIDFLTGAGIPPHVLADKSPETDPELYVRNVGFIPQNIDHPLHEEWEEKWLRAIVPLIKDSPAIGSICLTNEPAYAFSGRDAYSRPLWTQYLKDLHGGDVAAMNALYETDYVDFESVEVPIPEPIEPYNHVRPPNGPYKRLYYDYLMFHRDHFTEWHRNLDRIVNELAPDLATHIKTVAPATIGQPVLHWGVDPEAYADFTDIAGLDSHFWEHGPNSPYTYDWVSGYLGYDLFHSFRGQPVFNSENHILRDNQQTREQRHHAYAAMYQGAVHNGRMSAMWVWEAPLGGALGGNISIRPASIYDHGRAAFDMSRLNTELDALADAPPKVALMYSPTSIIWQETYQPATKQSWVGVVTNGQPVHFVTERQLAEGRVPESVTHIILQRITHAKDETVAALDQWVKDGGKVLKVGENVLTRDHYHREREVPEALAGAPMVRLSNENNPEGHRQAADVFRAWFQQSGLELLPLRMRDGGGPVHGVDYREADHPDGRLVTLANMMRDAKRVTLGEGEAIDLITGKPVDLSDFTLEPMRPMMLRMPGGGGGDGGEQAEAVEGDDAVSLMRNPVQNPKMGLGTWWWEQAGDGKGFNLAADRFVTHSPLRSLRLVAGPNAEGTGRAVQTVTDLTPGRTYRATWWTKGQAVPEGATLFAGKDGALAEVGLPAGEWDWREDAFTFTLPEGQADVAIGLAMPAGDGASVWYDDVALDLTPDEPATAAVADVGPLVVPAAVDLKVARATLESEASLSGDTFRLRMTIPEDFAADALTVTLDPTPPARLIGREERRAMRDAAEAPEVRNTPVAEKRDLYFPDAYGPRPDDALAFGIDLTSETPAVAAPKGVTATAERDGGSVTLAVPLADLGNPAALTLKIDGKVPTDAGRPVLLGEAALATSAQSYDAADLLTATFVRRATDPATVTFTLTPETGSPREVATVKMPADAHAAELRLPLQALPGGTHTLTATAGDLSAETTFTRADRRAELRAGADRLDERAARLAAEADSAGFREHPIINMGIALAGRFAERVRTGGRDGVQEAYWSGMQLEETAAVLDRTEALLAELKGGLELPGTVMRQTNAPLQIDGGEVTVEATPWGQPDATPERVTAFPLGYGHFMKAHHDLPNFPDYGAAIIQQGHGPALFRPDGTFPDDLGGIRAAASLAAANRMKIDYLAGGGLPGFVEAEHADDKTLYAPQVAFIEHNLDHPLVREWEGRFLEEMLPILDEMPAIGTICIVNEPAYVGSGRNPQSRPAYLDFLRDRHGDIDTLNDLYGTEYAGFDDVEVPGWRAPDGDIRENLEANRAYYDWATFNRRHFGEWHQWKADKVREIAPGLPTHAKVMADTVFSRRLAYKGTDPEAITAATDLAGVDAWHFQTNSMADPYSVGGVRLPVAVAADRLRPLPQLPRPAGLRLREAHHPRLLPPADQARPPLHGPLAGRAAQLPAEHDVGLGGAGRAGLVGEHLAAAAGDLRRGEGDV